MKKKLILVISAMLVLGLAVVVFSYGTTNDVTATAAACCCHGDSCPMKTKDASGKEVAGTHENCDCCKDGADSCPMMKKDADGKAMKMDGEHSCPMMNKDASATVPAAMKKEGADSCPMMKGGAHKMDAGHEMKTNGTGHSCSCCSHNKEKKDAPAI